MVRPEQAATAEDLRHAEELERRLLHGRGMDRLTARLRLAAGTRRALRGGPVEVDRPAAAEEGFGPDGPPQSAPPAATTPPPPATPAAPDPPPATAPPAATTPPPPATLAAPEPHSGPPSAGDLLRASRPMAAVDGDAAEDEEAGWSSFASGLAATDERLARLDLDLRRATSRLGRLAARLRGR